MNYHAFPSSQPINGGKKLALFDVDGTLVTSKSGRRWAANETDWIFLGDVPGTFKRYHDDGYTIALISNQSEWKLSDTPRAKFQSILDALTTANGWAPWCFIATAKVKEHDTIYRKPARGLYNLLLKEIGFTPTDVIMCGDACGKTDLYPPYRWSDSDYEFAKTIGSTFVRPLDVFPSTLTSGGSLKQEIVILVGNPGSNKSTTGRAFAEAGYIHLEQDVIGTKAAVLKAAKKAIAEKKSIVVDATHGSQTNRDPYIKLAKDSSVEYRIIWHIRDGRSFNALRDHPVPEVAYAIYTKHFVEPTENVQIIC